PCSRSPARNAATTPVDSPGARLLRNPITTAGSCAGGASGQPTVAPRSVTNVRRFIGADTLHLGPRRSQRRLVLVVGVQGLVSAAGADSRLLAARSGLAAHSATDIPPSMVMSWPVM